MSEIQVRLKSDYIMHLVNLETKSNNSPGAEHVLIIFKVAIFV